MCGHDSTLVEDTVKKDPNTALAPEQLALCVGILYWLCGCGGGLYNSKMTNHTRLMIAYYIVEILLGL